MWNIFKESKMHYIEPKSRAEIKLFPQVDNWVAPNNPVRLIDLVIDKLVLSNPEKFIWKGKSNTGRKSYSPATMLKLFLYGYLNKIPSSRRMETETSRNLELMWLLGDLHPDHWTINEYRKENKRHIRFVTIEFRRFLKAEGYIEGKEVATDGSKFKAYAARKILSLKNIEKRLASINEKLEAYLEEFGKASTIEDLAEELESDIGESIDQQLIDKIANLQAKIEKLENQKQELEKSGKNYLAPNDPDAKLMKSRDGKVPGYNIQSTVDKKHKMIATAEVTVDPNDNSLIKKNLEDLCDQLDISPETVEADKGYWNSRLIKEIEDNSPTKCYIPVIKSASKEKDKKEGIEFIYDQEKNEYTCSQGKTLKLKSKNMKEKNYSCHTYQCNDCQACPTRGKCTKSKVGRVLKRNIIQDWIDEYKKRLQGAVAKEKIKERKSIVEHPFGTLKWMMGKFHFLLTGKEKVQSELDLYTTAYNIKRLINIDNMETLLVKVNNYSWKRE